MLSQGLPSQLNSLYTTGSEACLLVSSTLTVKVNPRMVQHLRYLLQSSEDTAAQWDRWPEGALTDHFKEGS